jgi:2-oxoglutarate ferredoxin oxidoreductase subunit alpha
MRVFAPATVQEAADMTYAAFDYAEKDRNPVLILGDGVLGAIMEPVVLPRMRSAEEVAERKRAQADWALAAHDAKKGRAFIKPGCWSTKDQENTACMHKRSDTEDCSKDAEAAYDRLP